MSDADPFSVYLQLAEKVFKHEVKLSALSVYIRTLPSLDRELLDRLAEESEKASLSQPRMSWAICCVAEKASRQQKLDLFTRSLAAWYLGRAANRWVQPQKIAKAIARARRGFVKLGDAGWIAACDWMGLYHTFGIEKLINAEKRMEISCDELSNSNLSHILPLCQLTLAQIEILLNHFSKATSYLNKCENVFSSHNDKLNLARCWLTHADLLQRKKKFNKANKYISLAKAIFEKESSNLDLGYLYLSSGIIFLHSTTDFDLTLGQFNKAIYLFSNANLDLFIGVCLMYLGITYMQVGKYIQAASYYKKAEDIFKANRSDNFLAQNLTAYGKLNILLGDTETCIKQMQQAKIIHLKMQRVFSVGIDDLTLGQAYSLQGRYQDCLHSFESALEIMTQLNERNRLSLIQLNLASFYLNFGNYSKAKWFLHLAEKELIKNNQFDALTRINQLKATIFFEMGDYEKSQNILLSSLEIAENNNYTLQIAYINLFLGNLYMAWNKEIEALVFFERAVNFFSKMHSEYEIAACKISIGICLARINKKDQAKILLTDALFYCQGKYKELEWRTYSALAEIDDTYNAMLHYRQAITILKSIRDNFTQANLAGTYLQKPEAFISKAINHAVSLESTEDVIVFIEANKANILLNQLISQPQKIMNHGYRILYGLSSKICILRNEISIQNNEDNRLINTYKTKLLENKLQVLATQYEEQISYLERKNLYPKQQLSFSPFSLDQFIKDANEHFENNWIALDYYIINHSLINVIITPTSWKFKKTNLNHRFFQLINHSQYLICNNSNTSQGLFSELGRILLPEEVLSQSSENTTILIAPHQQLHGIPWSALGDQPLVTKTIPIIIPSLSCLQQLWNRPKQRVCKDKGLVIGVSEFNGRYPELKNIKEEITEIYSIYNSNVQANINTEMTFEKLKRELHKDTPIQWLHLATHFFNDTKTGRLGGFALKNEDIWLDQIRDLVPLPPLITLSGCSSLYNRIFSGDEQISLSSTCFIAGADSIVGSIWPSEDSITKSLMVDFYKTFFITHSSSKSLALAQRKAIFSNKTPKEWCGFSSFGVE